ncbi:IS3 family transposase [Georgenia sp. Z1344]|uniref:IS3 family transposase n=1 Tax=Georgenia sp. Z1344 TaxID=3416706 RepID=UPI003CFB0727
MKSYGTSQRATLELLGISRATWHYRRHPRDRVPGPVPQARRDYPNRVTDAEREQILGLIAQGFAVGRGVYSSWHDALDAGDPIASLRTWHRLAAAHLGPQRPSRPRRRRRASAMPQFRATAPNQVWCWDITKLAGKYHGQWLSLYLVIDVFSRLVVGWRVEQGEDDDLARAMFETAFDAQGTHPQIVHSDGGPSMMSDTLSDLYRELGITRSRNRPRVSNDNPYAESWFKTAKYQSRYPGWFHDMAHARRWATTVITDYNTTHRHTSLEGHTPQSVHDGSWRTVHHQRQSTLEDLAARHPERYPRTPRIRAPLANVTLNTEQSTQRLQTG